MTPPCAGVTGLVLAKAPVAGRVKTRLAASVGPAAAARLAAAALLDTLDAMAAAFGPARCRLALNGRLEDAVGGEDLLAALAGWTVVPQHGDTLGARIAHACAGAGGPVVQVGMDTPQVGVRLLAEVAAALDETDAVLGPAVDGGWWVLGLREPAHAAAIADVPMSTPTTGTDTRDALLAAGLTVATAPRLRDIDHLDDLLAVRRLAPAARFAAPGLVDLPGGGS
ncbi:TIGR04282 family arsenosugar biosynthesis glycosyltransferase [Nocardioides panacisoli]|uniref:DUF2064 domain-containing protein n=1 Tax=Nocardioides panacisoli TaxID=627624 RepID=A0ABP7IC35_9ACTN